jgi:hypothetical protein
VRRRDFLLLRVPVGMGAEQVRPLRSGKAAVADAGSVPPTRDDAAELSCESLYMRYVDAEADGTTARLFDMLAQDLRNARVIRVTDRSWLAREDLKTKVEEMLAAFVASGGRVA